MWNSYVRYHPRVGYTMMPSIQWRVAAEGQRGGYLAATNAAGFRSSFEYAPARTPGRFRATVFGDSQTAGDGVSNGSRYTDLVMKLIEGVELFNYGLAGTGPDQQYLIYQECAKVETDLVVIAMHVENISRVRTRHHVFRNTQKKEVVYAKPYYTLAGDALVLNQVPVPRELRSREDVSPEELPFVSQRNLPYPRLRKLAKALRLGAVFNRLHKRRPVPQYDRPDGPDWRLMRAILNEWIEGASAPVLLFPIPMWQFFDEGCDARGYQARFAELALDTGCYLHDPLPELLEYSKTERSGFRVPGDAHYTVEGHRALAISLAGAIRRIMADRQWKPLRTEAPARFKPARR